MKRLIASIIIAGALCAAPGFARTVHVRGHLTKSGTYVLPHNRTVPDHTKLNNWSTRGNVNPYTGKAGTKSPAPTKPRPYHTHGG